MTFATNNSDDVQRLEVLVILTVSLYNFRFIQRVGMYRSILAWQLTIMSLHVAPIISIQTLGLPSLTRHAACFAWSFTSWACRNCEASLFSLGLLVLELLACLALPKEPDILGAMLALQILIAVVAWGAMLAASCFAGFSFAPLDRHMNKGFCHMLNSSAARRCFLHEFVSHFVAQATFADLLRRQMERSPDPWLASKTASMALVWYGSLLLGTAALLPPHQLPYNLGAVPDWMRVPLVGLPGFLVADGASGEYDRNKLPWWMQMTGPGSELTSSHRLDASGHSPGGDAAACGLDATAECNSDSGIINSSRRTNSSRKAVSSSNEISEDKD
ncbi:unnamed protein product [Polarella glacialis]|uniref:Uncharacterized protein n=2 Tax=Polarella glacialis TaxID=89957 RepID=A0A813G909_POLGL|nr:unnamed protein product [Polarella glacialis]CAE8622657.1 unnamed protein product [Polarella glacialis]